MWGTDLGPSLVLSPAVRLRSIREGGRMKGQRERLRAVFLVLPSSSFQTLLFLRMKGESGNVPAQLGSCCPTKTITDLQIF